MTITYSEIFFSQNLLSKLPVKLGEKELPFAVKAKVIVVKVQYSGLIAKFEENMQESLKELKKDYPDFDKKAQDHERMKSIDERLKAYEEYSGEPDKRPSKPSDEELKEANKIRKGEKAFLEMNEKLTKEYNGMREKAAQESVEVNEKKFTLEEFSEIVKLLNETEEITLFEFQDETKNVKMKRDNFLSSIAAIFVE
jgi:hypothetical protein